MNRSRATINIDDGSGSICATISTPDIEKFIQFNPNSVRDAEENVRITILSFTHM